MTIGMAGLLNLSPVASPSTLGETLAKKLERIAQEAKAQDASRNSTGGITSGMDPVVNDVAQLEQDITGAGQQAAANGMANAITAQAEAGNESATRPRTLGGMLAPPVPPSPEPPAIGSRPRTVTPEAAPKPLTAREEAEAKVGPRTKMNKLGIALSAAAETIGGLPAAGGANRGATARAMGMHGAKIDAEEGRITAERARLQGEIDKGIVRAKGERDEKRQDRQLDQDLLRIQESIRNNKDAGDIKRLQIEARGLKDSLNETFRQQMLELKKQELANKGIKLMPGETFSIMNPKTGELVLVGENTNQVTTTTTTDNTKTAKDPTTGKEYSVNERSNATVTKGASKGPNGTVNAANPDAANRGRLKRVWAADKALQARFPNPEDFIKEATKQ